MAITIKTFCTNYEYDRLFPFPLSQLDTVFCFVCIKYDFFFLVKKRFQCFSGSAFSRFSLGSTSLAFKNVLPFFRSMVVTRPKLFSIFSVSYGFSTRFRKHFYAVVISNVGCKVKIFLKANWYRRFIAKKKAHFCFQRNVHIGDHNGGRIFSGFFERFYSGCADKSGLSARKR